MLHAPRIGPTWPGSASRMRPCRSTRPSVGVGDVTYIFAVAMRDGAATATFTPARPRDARVEVLGEGRTIDAPGGSWQDRFNGYQVHLYRITPADAP